MDDSLLQLINDSVMNHQWVILAIASVLLIVPLVLKALGKSVPIVDQIITIVASILRSFAKKPAPPPAQLPENQEGVAKVVPIREDKGPQP